MTTIPLPWPKPPVTLNQRGGSQVIARRMATAKDETRWLLRANRALSKPSAPVVLTLHWQPAVKRRRDVDNPMPTLKAVADALVAEGLLEDDDSEHVPVMACRIHPPVAGTPAAMWLEITEDRP